MANELVIENGIFTNIMKDQSGSAGFSFDPNFGGPGVSGYLCDTNIFALAAPLGAVIFAASYDSGGNPSGSWGLAPVGGGNSAISMALQYGINKQALGSWGGVGPGGFFGAVSMNDDAGNMRLMISSDPLDGGRGVLQVVNPAGTGQGKVYTDDTDNLAFFDGVTGILTLADLAFQTGVGSHDLNDYLLLSGGTMTGTLGFSGSGAIMGVGAGGEWNTFGGGTALADSGSTWVLANSGYDFITASEDFGAARVGKTEVALGIYSNTPVPWTPTGFSLAVDLNATPALSEFRVRYGTQKRLVVDATGQLLLSPDGSAFSTIIPAAANQSYTLPAASGTIALTSDIPVVPVQPHMAEYSLTAGTKLLQTAQHGFATSIIAVVAMARNSNESLTYDITGTDVTITSSDVLSTSTFSVFIKGA